MIVADYVAEFLASKGVKHIFGYQGGAVLKLLDSAVGNYGIEYVQSFHEQASSFAAEAYARVRGDIGVAIGTSGPGATNLINGIANAYFDSIPTIFLTGQDYIANTLGRKNARQNGFQDLDIVSIVSPICKYAVFIDDEKRIKYELEKAYHIATSGRKGPVVLDIPIDIQFKDIDVSSLEKFTPDFEISDKFDTSKFFELIAQSKKPIILAGGGIRLANAWNEFSQFAKTSNFPVVTTLNGIDNYEGTLGFAGLHGNSCANKAILNADLLIVLGSRLGQRQVGKKLENYTSAKIIHIDIDITEINRAVKTDLNINADLKAFLQEVNTKSFVYSDISIWKKQVTEWFEKYKDTVVLNHEKTDPVKLVRYISQFFADDTVITADVGQNQMWTAQGVSIKGSQRFLSSSGFGSMGYSLPAAIGVSYLLKSSVVAFTGDGGLQMNLQELNTLCLRQNNVKCVVFNNNTLGMMREVQKRYYNAHYIGANEQEFTCPNLKMLAETFNLQYILIENEKDFPKLAKAFSDDMPYLIDIRVEYNSKLLNRYDDEALNG